MVAQAKYDESVKADYVARRRAGHGNLAVCREMKINHKTGDRWWQEHRRKESRLGYATADPPKSRAQINQHKNAKRAYDDFVYFRLVVFGRKTPPWGRKAAEVMRAAVEEAHSRDRREYFLMNVFPGAGKTALLKDFCCWLIARNRDIRIIWGGPSDEMATTQTRQIRAELMRTEKWEGDEEDLSTGRAVKPRYCMIDLFGRFRPATHQGIAWQDGEWTVCKPSRHGDTGEGPPPVGPTMLAVGPRTKQYGRRANFIVWDDLWSEAENENHELGAKTKRFYDKTATSRLQPNGTLALIMQRLGPSDLSRHVLDKRRRSRDPETGDDTGYEPTYRHIVFPAHHDELCNGRHPTGAPAWDPDDPECRHDTRCGHCLTDPKALSPDDYLTFCETPDWPVVYQQRDVGTVGATFPEIWLTGGKDESGQMFLGCLDWDRGLWELPPGLDRKNLASAMAVDVGMSKYWGLYASISSTDLDVESEWILAADHRIMPAGTDKGLIDYDWTRKCYVGVMEDWYQMSKDLGVPFTHVVAEINCAQKHLFQGNNNINNWQLTRNCRIIAHECVDAQTEVLSVRGWLTYGEVSQGDFILTLNVESGLSEWQEVESVYRSLHDGPMYRFKTATMSALCTPDHTWPTTDQYSRPLTLVQTQHLNSGIVLPIARPLAPEQESPTLYADDLVELVGWAVTEGSFHPTCSTIAIAQSQNANPANCERIRLLLKRLGARWSENSNHVDNGSDVRVFSVSGPVARAARLLTEHGKQLPPLLVAGLPPHQRELLREVMVLADGWREGNGQSFCSSSLSLATAFEMLCALDGIATSFTVRPVGERGSKRKKPHYVIFQRSAKHMYLQNVGCRPTIVDDFKGVVWCPSTVNGTFYARREGKTYFTGNTKRNKNDKKLGVTGLMPMRYQLGAVRFPWRPGPTQDMMRTLYQEIIGYGQGGATDDILMTAWMRTLNRRRIQRAVAPVPSEPSKPVPGWISDMAARRAGSLR